MRLNLEHPDGSELIQLTQKDLASPLTRLLQRKGHPLNTRCGERGLCKACAVIVDGVEQQACQCRPIPDSHVVLPARSLLAGKPQVTDQFDLAVPYAHDPLFASEGFGAAVDIGTTTVSLLKVDLATGEILGKASSFNKQIRLGDDVLTRINLCLTQPEEVKELQKAFVEETLMPLMEEAGGGPYKGMVLSGNATMLHLALGENPGSMGIAPFPAVFLETQWRSSAACGWPFDIPLATTPSGSAYVGGDILAGLLSSGFLYDDGPSLLVDVGTNGEMVVKANGRMVGCATAAGPAFEGSGLTCGVRGIEGAISRIRVSAEGIAFESIGGTKRPVGICGSGYIDYLAEAYAAGLLTASGRVSAPGFPDEMIQPDEYGRRVVIAQGIGKKPITISESDVAGLLQAKAAIAAGMMILLKETGLKAEEIKTLYLAGGFGMHLDLERAVACGLLPGFHPDQIRLVGNTSLGGAFLALMDRSSLEEMEKARQSLQIIELNEDPDFEDTYIDCLSLDCE